MHSLPTTYRVLASVMFIFLNVRAAHAHVSSGEQSAAAAVL